MLDFTMLVAKFFMFYMIVLYNGIKSKEDESESYFVAEHPTVVYVDPKYFRGIKIISRRFSRQDPIYYVSWDAYSLYPTGNNVTYSLYFYEFLSNAYKRSFVEIHFKQCDILKKKNVPFVAPILEIMKQMKPGITCPYPPGQYRIQNVTANLSHMPNFPFQRGRVYLNLTKTNTRHVILSAYIDFQIKHIIVKKI